MADEYRAPDSTRDIIIEVRSDVRHIREFIEDFKADVKRSDTKQWEKIDEHATKIEGQENAIRFLSKGFWVGVTAVATGIAGVMVWLVSHGGK